ncbi:MAG: threonyl-tRNA synthetase editing domain-containing protein [Phycisphaerae bacterium]|nr:threonyl-tRNA synthetase editing domain-containing protein [Phycisphaerae bacterium]
MRILMWHCDSFGSELTEKGRSPLREDVGERTIKVAECLLVYAACEKQDEPDPAVVIEQTAAEVAKLARQLKVSTVVVHSFAHLFVDLASPQMALDVLKGVEAKLRDDGFCVFRTPFGWFNTLEIKAKGHPISRVAREIRPG